MSGEKMDTKSWMEEKLTGAIRALDLDIAVETDDGGHYLRFNLTGADSGHFLAHKAEPLKSMSFLLQTIYDKQYPEQALLVKVDAENHLKDREEELNVMVAKALEELTETGQKTALDPLNPYDRRLVHMILQENEAFKTHSEGTGHYKNVVIEKVS